jgi:hypothetical protein
MRVFLTNITVELNLIMTDLHPARKTSIIVFKFKSHVFKDLRVMHRHLNSKGNKVW